MKTIKDLKTEHINKIYSIIMGAVQLRTAGKIEWTTEHDFVYAVFKAEECVVNDNYDTVEYGIQINSDFRVDHVMVWCNKGGSAIDHQPLFNHHDITSYLIKEGFLKIALKY